jgi:small subunit ribosomal protein S9
MDTIHTIGRRKTSVARVFLNEGTGKIIINGKELTEYFTVPAHLKAIMQPFGVTDTEGKFDVKATIKGGGVTGQAEALRLGIARALVEVNPEFKPLLKKEKLMTRDPRMVERKKYGQPKARKQFQFSKR